MKFFSDRTFRCLRRLVIFVFRLAHPIVRVEGRENIPKGPVILCGNHSSFSDPIWLIGCSKLPTIPRTMAKRELVQKPILGWLLLRLSVIPVDRDGNDLTAMKTAMKTLREGKRMVIFPEGTRIRKGKVSEPHSGAVLLAVRTGAQLMPCYITMNKRFLGKIDVVYGEPYLPRTTTAKPSNDELAEITADLMKKIYAMGEEL